MINICIFYSPVIAKNEKRKNLFLGYLAAQIGYNLRDFKFVNISVNYNSCEIIAKVDIDYTDDYKIIIDEDIWQWSLSIFEWESVPVNSKIFAYKDNKIILKSSFNEDLLPDYDLKDSKWNSDILVTKLTNKLDTANSTIRAANIRINELKTNNENITSDFLKKINTANSTIRAANIRINELNKKSISQENSFLSCPYSILGINRSSNRNEIKKNYIRLSNIYHPDKSGNNEFMKYITTSYNKLR